MLDSGRRKSIDEIICKYDLEPSLEKEIYVEGSTDKALIDWFLKQSGINDITVLEIDTVNINASVIIEKKLDDNKRSRLIYLSSLVKKGIICIIDSDFNFLETPTYEKQPHLLSTDYSSMEMYFFNQDALEKILLGYPASKKPKDYNAFINMIGNILTEIFLIRFAKEKIKKELSHIEDFSKELTLNSNDIIFNRDKYLKKYVKNQKQLIKNFNSFIASQKTSLPNDFRQKNHGHDFIPLLTFYLGIKHKIDKETFGRYLYSSVEYNMLKSEAMFKTLIEKLTT